ncbi:MAG: 1-deoxy-D-xylulose-5-phosphate reductoisomerase [Bacteroidota bacterium]
MKKRVAILGSTGSIGKQALEVISAHSEEFEIEVLTANNNADELIRQAMQVVPNVVVIGNEAHYQLVRDSLAHYPIKVYAGEKSLEQVVEMEEIDIVLTAMVGFSGLRPTIAAIRAGKRIALANKETLVVAGELITRLAIENKVAIVPVDSEHSAIFQCLAGESMDAIEKIILTASGGPFRGKDEAFLRTVSCEEALNHPNWCMGPKITVDSASLMNKGLEVIEAKWLFGLQPEQIEVIVHPQSIIHSLVQFRDGSIKAQMGLPDMRLPIQYALGYPVRLNSGFRRFSFMEYPNLTFEQADTKKFRNLAIAFSAMERGGNSPCVMNAANEVAVEAFLNRKIGFMDIPYIVEETIGKAPFLEEPGLEDYFLSDKEARMMAGKLIKV